MTAVIAAATPEKNAPTAAGSLNTISRLDPALGGERPEHADTGGGDRERSRRRVASDREHGSGGDPRHRDHAQQDKEQDVLIRLPRYPVPLHARPRATALPPGPRAAPATRLPAAPAAPARSFQNSFAIERTLSIGKPEP